MTKPTKSETASVTLEFDLHDLPTAQHRAGLAGLILQIDAMGPNGYRKDPKRVPVIDKDSLTSTSVRITFTQDSLQGVFDELYAAKYVEVVVEKKWPGNAKPKPGNYTLQKRDPKTGNIKEIPALAYDVVQPDSPFLRRHLDGNQLAWMELWRQMLWAIPRGGNNVGSRAPFNDVAEGRPCGEGGSAWSELLKFEAMKAKSQYKTEPISGALMLGAQSVNAEGVPFSGRVDHNLLLHFWQLVVLNFVPQVVDKKDAKIKPLGYVIAIPDVGDLLEFREAFPAILQGLQADDPKRTPAKAKIDLAAQACLEVYRRLKDGGGIKTSQNEAKSRPPSARKPSGLRTETLSIAAEKAAEQAWSYSIRAVESFHMVKLGNNIKILSFARVANRPGLVERYENIIANYRNPMFRSALMRALIRGEPWYRGMIELFAEYPWPFFVEGEKTPRFLPRFGRDAKDQLRSIQEDFKTMTPDDMNEEDRRAQLAVMIQRLINAYVAKRAEAKTGIKVDGISKTPVKTKQGTTRMLRVYPKEFREAQQKVCTDAFLAMRSRHDQDFVEYFAGSICSAAQYLSKSDYQLLIQTLMTRSEQSPLAEKKTSWEDIKAIAMIALSSCAFNVRPRETESQGSK